MAWGAAAKEFGDWDSDDRQHGCALEETAVATTKKLLCPYDPDAPDKVQRDFLIPVVGVKGPHFERIRSGRKVQYGMVVYLGTEIAARDIVARMIEARRQPDSVDADLRRIDSYLEQLAPLKLGTIVEVLRADDGDREFALVPSKVQRQVRAAPLP